MGRSWWEVRSKGFVALMAASILLGACANSARTGSTSPMGASCHEGGAPLEEVMTVQVERLGETDGVEIWGALYPRPDYPGDPWSQWGQGAAIADGRFFSAIGDHEGRDGNSFIYEYDPQSRSLTLVADVLSHVDHETGSWGHGKIHSQMVLGQCEEIYFSSYWGSAGDIEFGGSYEGGVLFRLDPHQRTLEPMTVPVPGHASPSLAGLPGSSLVFGEAVDGEHRAQTRSNRGPLFVFDTSSGEVTSLEADDHVGFRSILVTPDETAYYSTGDGDLAWVRPSSDETGMMPNAIPGDRLRAVTQPASDGQVYGVTQGPDVFFVMEPTGEIQVLSEALGYTTSLAMHPDGELFYYMPGAHGNSGDWGSPLIAVSTSSGKQTVVAELADVVAEGLDVTLGGTYNLVMGPDGETIYMGANVSPSGEDDGFGEVALLVLTLP